MTRARSMYLSIVVVMNVAVALTAQGQQAKRSSTTQTTRSDTVPPDSVRVVANAHYEAGKFHRAMLGDGWRDIWGKPIVVPVLQMEKLGGGLEAKEVGGGHQTRSLRFKSKDGRSWTFRPLYKAKLDNLEQFEGTIVMDLIRDGLSANFPASPVVAPPFLEAVGVLHPDPALVVLPNDERLGEWRKEFAGNLGTIEEHLDDVELGKEDRGFAGAVEVVDSDHLLKSLNKDSHLRVDQRNYLRTRLVDMLLNDNDRHRDQWKWGRMRANDSLWHPISRDRDRVFISYEGILLRLAARFQRNLIPFRSSYASPSAAAGLELDLDGRLLDALNRSDWEHEIQFVTQAITDSVINVALARLPEGYSSAVPRLTGSLHARRSALRDVALRYYDVLARVVAVHATDSADVAEISRTADGAVDVELREPNGTAWYHRRFSPEETQELRVYLHGGDDSSVVRGEGPPRIELRVVGGGGKNVLADSESTRGAANATNLYDVGSTKKVKYEPDTAFNRRPWIPAYGHSVPPVRDFGTSLTPAGTIHTGHGLGLVPGIGISRTHYGFRRAPYEYRLSLLTEYSTSVARTRTTADADFRSPNSDRMIKFEVGMNDLELVRFAGFGNNLAYRDDPETDIRHRQWTARIAAGLALGPHSALTLGPVMKYATTDSAAGHIISQLHPYGFPQFGEVGAELRLNYDTRDASRNPHRGMLVRASAAAYPALWDVNAPFQHLQAIASGYVPVPIRKGSVLALRLGGERLLGDYPFFESAFLGGGGTLRVARYQQFVGDASLFSTAELRVPIAKVPLILPLDIGLIAGGESGKVFLKNNVHDGWHAAASAGFWVGVLGPTLGFNVLLTTDRDRRFVIGSGVNF
ncbi:MAG: BamA/TamA family outer membrane protein [Gemmatimonadaceae bacterium]